jgi:hypothetical protein
VSTDRARYGAQQRALLGALHTGEAIPHGFAIDDLAAASTSLLHKRARAVAQNWPALTHSLDGEFLATFERYARKTLPPRSG